MGGVLSSLQKLALSSSGRSFKTFPLSLASLRPLSQSPYYPPLTQESKDTDVIHCLADKLDQVTFPITFKSLCVALASLGTTNYHYLQDADYAAHHKLYNFMECAWDQLHPT